MKDLAHDVRDSLFLAASRTYGEQYIEPIIRKKYGLSEPISGDHDAVDEDGLRYEIKASKVMRKRHNLKGKLLDRVLYELTNSPLKRYFNWSDRYKGDYDANIQNVKRDHFDILIYVLLFKDCLVIFTAPKESIVKGEFKHWSDKHGRYDQEGKSGQFPISKVNIKWHEENHMKYIMEYDEATRLLKEA